ncbi:MAG: hypothetical protein V4648_08580 [Bacteroidota bacterium]
MGNQDKIFDQIKTAAEKAETKDFPSMENVWSRVEGKLDKKVLKKENTLWKKIAVAASILLVISIGYQYFTSQEKVATPKNDITIIDTTKAITPKNQEQSIVSSAEITNPAIKENANAIIEKQVAPSNQIVINNNYTITSQDGKSNIITDSVAFTNQGLNNLAYQSNTTFYNRPISARGVVHKDAIEMDAISDMKKEKQEVAKKLDPLIVIDNSTKEQKMSNVASDDVESIEVLTDPLYIINGVYYTEKELFGPNSTSPYAPLSKLEIDTISILQNEKATAIYGEKGKKGVVIITTKTGKPSFKKE